MDPTAPTRSLARGTQHLAGVVVAFAVGFHLGLLVPRGLELALGVEEGLVEPVGRSRIAGLAELEDRLRTRLVGEFDDADKGVAADAVAALLAGLRKGVKVEDDASRPRRPRDGQARLVVPEGA